MPPVAKVFEMISTAHVSTSAQEGKEALFLRKSDGITMNRDRLLADAKAKALSLVEAGYVPPEPPELTLPGPSGRAALHLAVDGFRANGMATAHDEVVSKRLAKVLTGGETDPTADSRTYVGQDVTEQIVGHNNIKPFGLGQEEHRSRIHMQIVGLNVRVLGRLSLESTPPQISGMY